MQKRCAIYTRSAIQSETCVIQQRKNAERMVEARWHEGWIAMPDHYDDSGFSGCLMERPALQRLFRDIEQGLIDIVIVENANRLSRSMMDFVKIATFFDKHDVTLVSAAEKIGTDTPVGSLVFWLLQAHAEYIEETVGGDI